MTDERDHDVARRVFAGLAPSVVPAARRSPQARERTAGESGHVGREAGHVGRGVRATMPLVLAGAMTVALNVTAPVEASAAEKRPVVKTTAKHAAPAAHPAAAAPAAAAPAKYTVQAGDTVSGIASRFGLSTASVLALNGLGWKSLIFPGQVLKLTNAKASPAAVATPATAPAGGSASYAIRPGDTIAAVAKRHGVSTQAVLSANGLGWSSIIYPGQVIRIPGASGSAVSGPGASGPGASILVQTVSNLSPAPASSSDRLYTIAWGDTVSSIAKRFGVTVATIQQANGLGRSSIIYAGKTLVIPAVSVLTPEMAQNARIILEVGRALGVSERGQQIALATAMQESGLRNLPYGDRDSVGLFQQRPSAGWGTKQQLLDPYHASRLFFGGPSNPNRGVTRGLLDIPGWEGMSLTQAAQKVQISAFPDAYAKWEQSARAWLDQLS